MGQSEAQRIARPQGTSEGIANDIRERIASGALRPGDDLPAMSALQAEYGVARMTVTRALRRLKSEGLAYTQPGAPLRVQDQRAGVSPYAQFGRVRSTGKIRLDNEWTDVEQTGTLDASSIDPHVREALDLSPQSGSVLYRRRLIYRDGQLLQLVTSWFPKTHFSTLKGWSEVEERILDRKSRMIGGSATEIAHLLGEDVSREDFTASAVAASTLEAAGLKVNPGAPILRVVATSWAGDWPVECGVYSFPASVTCDFPSARYLD